MSVQVAFTDIIKRRGYFLNQSSSPNLFAEIGSLFYEASKIIERHSASTNESANLTSSEKLTFSNIIDKLSSVQGASSYYEEALQIIDNLNKVNSSFANSFTESFCTVIPYIMNLEGLAYSVGKNYPNIHPEQIKMIQEEAEKQIVVDRILKNHENIDSKFSLSTEASKYKGKGPTVISEVCSYYINKYNIDTYKKFNIAIEEMCYLLGSHGSDAFIKSIEPIKEYFMLSNPMTANELVKMEKVIKESYVIPEAVKKEIISKSNFVHEKVSIFGSDVETGDMVQNFKTGEGKSIEDFRNIITHFIENDDILRNLEEILLFIFKATICGTFSRPQYEEENSKYCNRDAVLFITDKIRCMIKDEMYNRPLLSREELNVIINIYRSLEDEIRQKYSNTVFADMANEYCDILRDASNSLIEDLDLAIPKYKLQEDLSSDKTYSETQYESYRFNHLLSLAENISKSIEESNVIFDKNNKDMYSYMGPDQKIDITISQKMIEDETNEAYIEAENDAIKFCKFVNESFVSMNESDTIKVYYEMVGNIVEIHLIETARILVKEENLNKIYELSDNSMDLYYELYDIAEEFASYIYENEDNKVDLCEAFSEGYLNEGNNNNKEPKFDPDLKDNWKPPAGTKFNLNNLKLGIMGIRSKAKKLGQKEREVSRGLDNTCKLFMKSLQKALISDRREAIIKGSVIPSFSKLIKIGLVLGLTAGVPLVVANSFAGVVVAAIAALGGFAASKNLTRKERLLLLDEIEIELDIIDKEISNAESKNQIKKMRILMRQKKELQRQYQRIRYNIRVGKDILPGSSMGIPARED